MAKSKGKSPTQRTRDWLKLRGITSQIVERWNAFARIRQDLFGFGDVLALGGRITAIQVTSGPNVAARINKIYELPEAREWLESGGLIEVHGWRKSARTNRWELRRVSITLDGMGAMMSTEVSE
jgi:hypothetical protein